MNLEIIVNEKKSTKPHTMKFLLYKVSGICIWIKAEYIYE